MIQYPVYIYTGCNKDLLRSGRNHGVLKIGEGGVSHTIYIPTRKQTFIINNESNIELKTDKEGNKYIVVHNSRLLGTGTGLKKEKLCVLNIYPCLKDVKGPGTSKLIHCYKTDNIETLYDAIRRSDKSHKREVDELLEQKEDERALLLGMELPIPPRHIPKGGYRHNSSMKGKTRRSKGNDKTRKSKTRKSKTTRSKTRRSKSGRSKSRRISKK